MRVLSGGKRTEVSGSILIAEISFGIERSGQHEKVRMTEYIVICFFLVLFLF